MIETVARLRGDRFILVVVLLACVVCPGFALFYVFDQPAFQSLDFGKLTMLSLAIAAPVFLLNLLPSVLYIRLGSSALQPETLISQIAKDTPGYDEVVKRIELQRRRDYRNQTDAALALASVISVVPLYVPM